MILNYLIIAFRNIIRNKGFALINLLGLSLGLAVTIMIGMYVVFELRYDKFHENYEHIYRVEQDFGGTGKFIALSQTPIGDRIKKDFPGIKNNTKIKEVNRNSSLFLADGTEFSEESGFYADSNFFNVFTYHLIEGDKKTGFSEPNTIMISEELAKKMFGDEDPLGKIISIDNEIKLKVNAILQNPPENSHLNFSFLVSVDTYKEIGGQDYASNWRDFYWFNYLVLEDQTSVSELNEKIYGLLRITMWETHPSHVYVEPLSNFHFSPKSIAGPGQVGNLSRIKTLIAIGLLILVIATINFINLKTANSTTRAKEVGVRKVIGANKSSLVTQFLMEAILLSLIAVFLAALFIFYFLPTFNEMMGSELKFNLLQNIPLLFIMLFFGLFVGFLSGLYPAFALSSYKPIKVLKGISDRGSSKSIVRTSLVILQFVVTLLLIIGSIMIYKQMYFLKNKDLGYNKEQLYAVQFINSDTLTLDKYNSLKLDLLTNPNIESISISRFISNGTYGYQASDYEGSEDQEMIEYVSNNVDKDYAKTWGLKLVDGRLLTDNFYHDSLVDCYVNEALVERLGWKNPIGKRIGLGHIIGVVGDFHMAAIRNKIEPMVIKPLIHTLPFMVGKTCEFVVKLKGTNIDETVNEIDAKFAENFPGKYADGRFYDEDFEILLRHENSLFITIKRLTILAIIIAFLGLFGLASFVVVQKTKEIGIRKVHGASIRSIVGKISADFLKWITIANIIAIPIGFYIMNNWLENFSYTTTISWWVFALAAVSSIIIMLITISFHSIKAAIQNPINALRYE
jgi:putative ABC transport system permease protein